ncbi:hypothetical protein C1H76_6310 [Elsinoe australis]|uniref:Uncharacterized protein n=1 Tax=Elsinoe australis TaxID=40998 RepID=A0A4U7ATV9_9PEZI|nr:hypothetical protein C1H76_6310 [Elsinoe australis]
MSMRPRTSSISRRHRSAVSIPNLVTLHIANFPASYTLEELTEQRYWTLVKEHANDIFQTTRVRYDPDTVALVEVLRPRPLRYLGFGSAPNRTFYQWPTQMMYTQGEVRISDEIREMVTVEVDRTYREREGGPNSWLLDEPLSFMSWSSMDLD